MQFTIPATRANSIPQTLIAAHMRYLVHYRAYRRSSAVDENGQSAPQQWDIMTVMIMEETDTPPGIMNYSAKYRPRWMKDNNIGAA